MRGGKVRYYLTLILLLPIAAASLAAAACAPLGTVFEPGIAADEMWVVPRRHEYKAGEYYKPVEDVYAYVSNEGMVESVPVSRVNISIVTNPDASVPSAPVSVPVSGIELSSSIGIGRKLVYVAYGNFAANYSIEVRDVLGGTGGDGTGDGSGFVVIWK